MKQKKASALKKTGGKKKPSAASQGRQEQLQALRTSVARGHRGGVAESQILNSNNGTWK